jgi:hypothetical protein
MDPRAREIPFETYLHRKLGIWDTLRLRAQEAALCKHLYHRCGILFGSTEFEVIREFSSKGDLQVHFRHVDLDEALRPETAHRPSGEATVLLCGIPTSRRALLTSPGAARGIVVARMPRTFIQTMVFNSPWTTKEVAEGFGPMLFEGMGQSNGILALGGAGRERAKSYIHGFLERFAPDILAPLPLTPSKRIVDALASLTQNIEQSLTFKHWGIQMAYEEVLGFVLARIDTIPDTIEWTQNVQGYGLDPEMQEMTQKCWKAESGSVRLLYENFCRHLLHLAEYPGLEGFQDDQYREVILRDLDLVRTVMTRPERDPIRESYEAAVSNIGGTERIAEVFDIALSQVNLPMTYDRACMGVPLPSEALGLADPGEPMEDGPIL